MHITLVAALTVAMVVCLLISLATEEAANRLEENAEAHVKSETALRVAHFLAYAAAVLILPVLLILLIDENLPLSPSEETLGNAGNRGNVFLQLLCAAGIALLASDVAVHNRALKEKRPRVFRVLSNVREVCGVAVVAGIAGLVAWYISDTLIQRLIDTHEKFSQSISQYCKGAC